MQKFTSKQLFFAGFGAPLVLGLILGIIFFGKFGPAKAEEQHVTGNKNAKIKIVEYSDFQCPYCERAYPILKQLRETYGDKISFEYKQFPLSSIHQYAEKAAEASECAAEQGKFWEFHDKVFENQSSLSFDALKQWAVDLKLNTNQFNSCLDSGKYAAKVAANQKDGEALGVNGTPTTFINGQSVVGAQPFEAFKTIVDNLLK